MYNKKNFSKSIDFKKLEIPIRSLFRKEEVIKTKKNNNNDIFEKFKWTLILFIIKYVNPSNMNIMIFKLTTKLPAINETGKKYTEISINDNKKFFLNNILILNENS